MRETLWLLFRYNNVPIAAAGGGTLLYHKIYMYVPSKFTIKKDYFFHENKVKCN